tara:strand:- start:1122 stop:1622 length:501 start_codon:yes stop_codon:yes gene_type:complete
MSKYKIYTESDIALMLSNNAYFNGDLSPMQKGRLKKCLDKQYKYNEKVLTLGEILKPGMFKFEVDGEYHVEFNDSSFIPVPKIVFDNVKFKFNHIALNDKAEKRKAYCLTYTDQSQVLANEYFLTEKDVIDFVNSTFDQDQMETIEEVFDEHILEITFFYKFKEAI